MKLIRKSLIFILMTLVNYIINIKEVMSITSSAFSSTSYISRIKLKLNERNNNAINNNSNNNKNNYNKRIPNTNNKYSSNIINRNINIKNRLNTEEITSKPKSNTKPLSFNVYYLPHPNYISSIDEYMIIKSFINDDQEIFFKGKISHNMRKAILRFKLKGNPTEKEKMLVSKNINDKVEFYDLNEVNFRFIPETIHNNEYFSIINNANSSTSRKNLFEMRFKFSKMKSVLDEFINSSSSNEDNEKNNDNDNDNEIVMTVPVIINCGVDEYDLDDKLSPLFESVVDLMKQMEKNNTASENEKVNNKGNKTNIESNKKNKTILINKFDNEKGYNTTNSTDTNTNNEAFTNSNSNDNTIKAKAQLDKNELKYLDINTILELLEISDSNNQNKNKFLSYKLSQFSEKNNKVITRRFFAFEKPAFIGYKLGFDILKLKHFFNLEDIKGNVKPSMVKPSEAILSYTPSTVNYDFYSNTDNYFLYYASKRKSLPSYPSNIVNEFKNLNKLRARVVNDRKFKEKFNVEDISNIDIEERGEVSGLLMNHTRINSDTVKTNSRITNKVNTSHFSPNIKNYLMLRNTNNLIKSSTSSLSSFIPSSSLVIQDYLKYNTNNNNKSNNNKTTKKSIKSFISNYRIFPNSISEASSMSNSNNKKKLLSSIPKYTKLSDYSTNTCDLYLRSLITKNTTTLDIYKQETIKYIKTIIEHDFLKDLKHNTNEFLFSKNIINSVFKNYYSNSFSSYTYNEFIESLHDIKNAIIHNNVFPNVEYNNFKNYIVKNIFKNEFIDSKAGNLNIFKNSSKNNFSDDIEALEYQDHKENKGKSNSNSNTTTTSKEQSKNNLISQIKKQFNNNFFNNDFKSHESNGKNSKSKTLIINNIFSSNSAALNNSKTNNSNSFNKGDSYFNNNDKIKTTYIWPKLEALVNNYNVFNNHSYSHMQNSNSKDKHSKTNILNNFFSQFSKDYIVNFLNDKKTMNEVINYFKENTFNNFSNSITNKFDDYITKHIDKNMENKSKNNSNNVFKSSTTNKFNDNYKENDIFTSNIKNSTVNVFKQGKKNYFDGEINTSNNTNSEGNNVGKLGIGSYNYKSIINNDFKNSVNNMIKEGVENSFNDKSNIKENKVKKEVLNIYKNSYVPKEFPNNDIDKDTITTDYKSIKKNNFTKESNNSEDNNNQNSKGLNLKTIINNKYKSTQLNAFNNTLDITNNTDKENIDSNSLANSNNKTHYDNNFFPESKITKSNVDNFFKFLSYNVFKDIIENVFIINESEYSDRSGNNIRNTHNKTVINDYFFKNEYLNDILTSNTSKTTVVNEFDKNSNITKLELNKDLQEVINAFPLIKWNEFLNEINNSTGTSSSNFIKKTIINEFEDMYAHNISINSSNKTNSSSINQKTKLTIINMFFDSFKKKLIENSFTSNINFNDNSTKAKIKIVNSFLKELNNNFKTDLLNTFELKTNWTDIKEDKDNDKNQIDYSLTKSKPNTKTEVNNIFDYISKNIIYNNLFKNEMIEKDNDKNSSNSSSNNNNNKMGNLTSIANKFPFNSSSDKLNYLKTTIINSFKSNNLNIYPKEIKVSKININDFNLETDEKDVHENIFKKEISERNYSNFSDYGGSGTNISIGVGDDKEIGKLINNNNKEYNNSNFNYGNSSQQYDENSSDSNVTQVAISSITKSIGNENGFNNNSQNIITSNNTNSSSLNENSDYKKNNQVKSNEEVQDNKDKSISTKNNKETSKSIINEENTNVNNKSNSTDINEVNKEINNGNLSKNISTNTKTNTNTKTDSKSKTETSTDSLTESSSSQKNDTNPNPSQNSLSNSTTIIINNYNYNNNATDPAIVKNQDQLQSQESSETLYTLILHYIIIIILLIIYLTFTIKLIQVLYQFFAKSNYLTSSYNLTKALSIILMLPILFLLINMFFEQSIITILLFSIDSVLLSGVILFSPKQLALPFAETGFLLLAILLDFNYIFRFNSIINLNFYVKAVILIASCLIFYFLGVLSTKVKYVSFEKENKKANIENNNEDVDNNVNDNI